MIKRLLPLVAVGMISFILSGYPKFDHQEKPAPTHQPKTIVSIRHGHGIKRFMRSMSGNLPHRERLMLLFPTFMNSKEWV